MADANRLVTEHIDVWANAIKKRNSQGRGSNKKIELTGIKKLRELILDLAVRGKLVPQYTDDEPASVLLDKIAIEKYKLVADNKIKKQKALSAITDKECPFELPIGWQWSRLGSVGLGATGKTPSTKHPEFFDGDIQFVGPGNITPQGVMLKSDKFLTELGIEQSTSALLGDILMVCIGGSIGKSAIANERIAFNQQINAMRPIEILSAYLKITVSTNVFYQAVIDKSTGSATPIINRGKWEELIVPIAPLAEQHRIVAKVDELMLLCDDLEQQTEESISAHQTLVEVLLSTLTNPTQATSEKADTFQKNWQRIAEHFHILFTTEHSIEQLKQTILQLAVMGKLVPQNSKDEPASVLLKKITKEKEQLIADKKIKKQKPLPAITNDEKPFELPLGWEWTKLGDISLIKGGFAYKSALFVDNGEYQVIRMGNIRPDYFRLNENSVFIDSKLADSTEEYEILTGDILLTMTGTKGKRDYLYSLMVNDSDLNDRQLYLNQRLCISRPLLVDSQFVNLLLKDDRFLDYVFAKSTGTANQANVGMVAIQNWTLPLPPINEQKEIVIMANALMENCEQLKAHLSEAQITQLQLADTIVEQAVN
jgi:type I restriction enzyme S subunit